MPTVVSYPLAMLKSYLKSYVQVVNSRFSPGTAALSGCVKLAAMAILITQIHDQVSAADDKNYYYHKYGIAAHAGEV